MKSRATRSFWDAFYRLPPAIRKTALKQYDLWLQDPHHSSVRFKKVGAYWSARVTDDYRAVGILAGEAVVGFFIGSHADDTPAAQ